MKKKNRITQELWEWAILLGTTYLVFWLGHSLWLYLLAMILIGWESEERPINTKVAAHIIRNHRDMSCWEILHCCPLTSKGTIDAVYKARAKQLHPDLGGDGVEFLALNEAYKEAIRQKEKNGTRTN